jgi:hypothetical protein
MTDNRLAFSTGYTPPETKVCIRCFKEFDDPLYVTCQVCRDRDRPAEYFIDPSLLEEQQANAKRAQARGAEEYIHEDELAKDEALTREVNSNF